MYRTSPSLAELEPSVDHLLGTLRLHLLDGVFARLCVKTDEHFGDLGQRFHYMVLTWGSDPNATRADAHLHNSFLQQPFRNGCLESYFRRLVLNN